MDVKTFHVIIERTLITPSDPPNATRGLSPAEDLERNSILQWKMEFRDILIKTSNKLIFTQSILKKKDGKASEINKNQWETWIGSYKSKPSATDNGSFFSVI